MADSTVYTFDFPGNDPNTLDTALTLTRDIASEVQFDPKAVDSERQVVLAEYRLRDTPLLHMARTSQAAMFGERLAEAYMPIGSQAAITAATADDLKAYYRAHYRPERAVLIVIGEVDAKALEAAIKARFADWKAAAPAPATPSFTYPDLPKTATIKLFTENGANSAVQMTWTTPLRRRRPKPAPAIRARDGPRMSPSSILNLRLHALATSADPPFLAGRAPMRRQQLPHRLRRLARRQRSAAATPKRVPQGVAPDAWLTVSARRRPPGRSRPRHRAASAPAVGDHHHRGAEPPQQPAHRRITAAKSAPTM
jgi:zinc protease